MQKKKKKNANAIMNEEISDVDYEVNDEIFDSTFL